jgi:ribonucleoside-diphosphate reductase alpha chain
MTVEGAPHLKAEHLPGVRLRRQAWSHAASAILAAESHIRMMAAAQPFISGAISKTIQLAAFEADLSDVRLMPTS